MKRSPLKRQTRLRRVSKKTRTIRWPRLKALREHVLVRAKHRCEFCGSGGRLDIHHVVRRSAKRDDSPDNAVALDRVCHRLTEAPYETGRLVITPLGNESFNMRIIRATDKWQAVL